MIVFVTVSSRRFMVLDVPKQEGAWSCTVPPTPGNLGYLHTRAEIIAGPVDYEAAVKAASDHARHKGTLISIEEWERIKKERGWS